MPPLSPNAAPWGVETIRFYDTRGEHPVVSECYLGQPVGGSAADPTWAPDGSAVAWAEGDGIWSTPVGALDSTDCSWAKPHLIIAAVGAFIIFLGIVCLCVQLAVSIRDRKQAFDLTGDPWNGRSLEWATSSPPAPAEMES